MELVLILLAVLQSTAISLGMGGSTFAILNFFAAIADGVIDEKERNLMGIVYVVLRIAMVVILVTTAVLTTGGYTLEGTAYFTPSVTAVWTLIFVLYANAILMTKRIMPSTLGPGIQASTWYTLGVLSSLFALGLSSFSYLQFFLCYLAAVVFAISLVNGVMAYLKGKK